MSASFEPHVAADSLQCLGEHIDIRTETSTIPRDNVCVYCSLCSHQSLLNGKDEVVVHTVGTQEGIPLSMFLLLKFINGVRDHNIDSRNLGSCDGG